MNVCCLPCKDQKWIPNRTELNRSVVVVLVSQLALKIFSHPGHPYSKFSNGNSKRNKGLFFSVNGIPCYLGRGGPISFFNYE